MTDFNLLLSKPITINGNTGHLLLYTYYDPNFEPTEARDIIMTNGYNMYGITYFAEPSEYEKYFPIIDTMINSFLPSTESISTTNPYLGTDRDASDMILDILGDETEVSPKVAEGLSNMLEMESQTNEMIIGNIN